MKYTTTDELEHFSFAEAYIADVQLAGGFFHMTLSNVTILPENSCNRDIREMRANDLVLKIKEPVIPGAGGVQGLRRQRRAAADLRG